jgi:hypothetical protein
MNKICFVVEGPSDAVFVCDYIHYALDGSGVALNARISSKIKTGNHYSISADDSIKLLVSGGCSNLVHLKVKLLEQQDQGYRLAVVQDADDAVKDPHKGGCLKRMTYLAKLKSDIAIEFDTFLFPNNSNDGDLETLLLSLTNEEKYTPYHECYHRYSEEVRAFSCDDHANELMERKSLVFNYCQVYQGMGMSSEIDRHYRPDYWTLDSPEVEPFKTFIKKVLGT